MGRPSKLTEKQWDLIRKRLLSGETASSLAREFGISKSAISERVSKRIETVKSVANQIVAADVALKSLPISEQYEAVSFAENLKAMNMHMAGAGKFNSATSHRLAGIANGQIDKIDDANPMESQEVLQGVAALLKLSNESAVIPLGLIKANAEMMREQSAGGQQSNAEILKELVQSLPL